jgi:flagellar biosynthesis component FlhA
MSGRGLAIASIPTGFVVFFVVQIAFLGTMAASFVAYRHKAKAVRQMEIQRQRVMEEKYRREAEMVEREQQKAQILLERKISELTKQLAEAKDEASRQQVREAIRRMRETSSRMARERRRERLKGRSNDPLGGLGL